MLSVLSGLSASNRGPRCLLDLESCQREMRDGVLCPQENRGPLREERSGEERGVNAARARRPDCQTNPINPIPFQEQEHLS